MLPLWMMLLLRTREFWILFEIRARGRVQVKDVCRLVKKSPILSPSEQLTPTLYITHAYQHRLSILSSKSKRQRARPLMSVIVSCCLTHRSVCKYTPTFNPSKPKSNLKRQTSRDSRKRLLLHESAIVCHSALVTTSVWVLHAVHYINNSSNIRELIAPLEFRTILDPETIPARNPRLHVPTLHAQLAIIFHGIRKPTFEGYTIACLTMATLHPAKAAREDLAVVVGEVADTGVGRRRS